MPDYRYLFADALTGQLTEELPLVCRSFSQQISGIGQATGTLAVADPDIPTLWRQATEVKRSLLLVQRDDVPTPVWGGMVMKRRPTGTGHTGAEISAETLEGYLQRRRIKTDLAQTNVDLFNIVRAIIGNLQAVLGGNLRMLVSSGLHGSTTTITYAGKDRTKALDAIDKLAEVSPFEYTITWDRSSGSVFTPTLVLSAPGLSSALTPLLLEFPGSLAEPVDVPEDGGDEPNAVTGIGTGTAADPILSEALDTTGELAAGYPIHEDEVQFRDEVDAGRLAARTLTALRAKLADSAVPAIDLRPPEKLGDITLSDLALGLAVRLRCACPYHPPLATGVPSFDVTTRRVTGWTVVPGSVEKTTLTLGSITGKITPPARNRSIADYLRDLDRRIRELATRT